MADEPPNGARPARAARLRAPSFDDRSPQTLQSGPTGRPSDAENEEARTFIDAMLALKMLRGKATAVTTNVIALALATKRSDSEVRGLSLKDKNRLFGVPEEFRGLQQEWVDDEHERLDFVENEYFTLPVAQREYRRVMCP